MITTTVNSAYIWMWFECPFFRLYNMTEPYLSELLIISFLLLFERRYSRFIHSLMCRNKQNHRSSIEMRSIFSIYYVWFPNGIRFLVQVRLPNKPMKTTTDLVKKQSEHTYERISIEYSRLFSLCLALSIFNSWSFSYHSFAFVHPLQSLMCELFSFFGMQWNSTK